MSDPDPVRPGDLPHPDVEDEQAVLDFLRGAGHAGLAEVIGLYELVGALERALVVQQEAGRRQAALVDRLRATIRRQIEEAKRLAAGAPAPAPPSLPGADET